MDLYTILFTYALETVNHRIAPCETGYPARQDQTGTLLAISFAENGFDKFCVNFQTECANSFVFSHIFDNIRGLNLRVTSNRISLLDVQMVDDSACVGLLRGISAPDSIERPERVIKFVHKVARSSSVGIPRPSDLLQDMTHAFGVHAPASVDHAWFGIARYARPVSYDLRDFAAYYTDTLDPGVLDVLRGNNKPFIENHFAGPAVQVEVHTRKRGIIIRTPRIKGNSILRGFSLSLTQILYGLGVATEALAGDTAGGQEIRALDLREMLESKFGEVVIGIPKEEGDERYGHDNAWDRESVKGRDRALEDRVRASESGEADEYAQHLARDYARQHDRSASGVMGGDGAGAEDSLLREEGPFADVHASEWDRKASYAQLPMPNTPNTSDTNMNAQGTPAIKSEKPKPIVQNVEETRVHKVWKALVRMKHPDIQQARREKATIRILIFGACGGAILHIIVFGKLLYPEFDKAWNVDQLDAHSGENDSWAAVRRAVYAMTSFWQDPHSDIQALPSSQDVMKELWGQGLTPYFPIPLTLGYSGLVADQTTFKQQPGQDISYSIRQELAEVSPKDSQKFYQYIRNVFYVRRTDFRDTPKCTFGGVSLTVLTAILATVIVAKKRKVFPLDYRFARGAQIQQQAQTVVPVRWSYPWTRQTINPPHSLDILGVDPALNPEPLRFGSAAEGVKQLNYEKVYSGLYGFEGHVVPYTVVVETGKPSETSKPGNRGKRDPQILLLHYLNRVHFDAPMSPLELEIYHQIRNGIRIRIDPAFYEYIFMVDADMTVTPDSLNRLVACAADDSATIGICRETKLDNEEGSWWNMIQASISLVVYEYYILHHLAKAFESLFGSVTCLPGCFPMYRIRTANKGRPIISNRIIDGYSEGAVDTLDKNNLLSLGEDRYLTTLIMKHFPTFKMKFTSDAITMAT
ncbi:hypothetical protein FRC09_000546 [Ceratobasidium sp. 395]|nr:hypothetical protein FRC09_000546 [Ceratobasidium sp. 395]